MRSIETHFLSYKPKAECVECSEHLTHQATLNLRIAICADESLDDEKAPNLSL